MGSRSFGRRTLVYALFLVVVAAVAGCARTLPQNFMDTRGQVAHMQTGLFKLSLWFAGGIGLGVTLILVYVIIRFRNRPGDQREPKQIHGNAKLEIGWTFIPIVILAIVAVPTVSIAFKMYAPDRPADMTVRVVGNQWFWNFEYTDLKFMTSNELVIPTGRAVAIQMTSHDVIHSFWVPKLAGKTDVIPGRTNQMWIQADEPGLYFGQCAEFCGTAHAQMRFRVHAVSAEAFDAWAATRQKGAKVPTDPVALAGKALFEGANNTKANCWVCHSVDGTKAKGVVGPNLTNIGERGTIAAGILDNNEANLRNWIRTPQALKPGAKMQAHPNLTEQELTSIIRYLQSLR